MGHTGAGFTANLDEMQRVIDGDLHNAIQHFTTISDQIQTLPGTAALRTGPDIAGVSTAFSDALGQAFDEYKREHQLVVQYLNDVSRLLQHVVDTYRQAETTNAQGIRSCGRLPATG